MTADPRAARRSPLAGTALPDGIRERPFHAQLDVRLDPADATARAGVEAAVGPLPVEPNTAHGDGEASVLWLGPDEWLVVGPPDGEGPLERQLRESLGEAAGRVAIVDVSANRTIVELARPDARAILEGGCPIDLHPRAFGPGRCAQTLVARANVIVHQLGSEPEPVFRLFVRPSFAAYLATWLTDAANA